MRLDASGCNKQQKPASQKDSPKPLRVVVDLDEGARRDAKQSESTPGRIRTCGLRIRNPDSTPINPEENAHSSEGAAQGAAVDAVNISIDSDLTLIIDVWPSLPEPVRAGILAMVKAVKET